MTLSLRKRIGRASAKVVIARLSAEADAVVPAVLNPFTPDPDAWSPDLLNTEFIAPPVGPEYVSWDSLYVAGDNIVSVLKKVPTGKYLTLPEGTFEYSGFTDTTNGNSPTGLRLGPLDQPVSKASGIIGSGRGTIIKIVAGTSNLVVTNAASNCPVQLTIHGLTSARLENFTLEGTTQGGNHWYHGISVYSCHGAVLSGLYLKGASHGAGASPATGETFGINVYKSNDVIIRDSEVDGRDATTGLREGASPIGWNGSSGSGLNARVLRVYAHHGVAGMVTFWQTIGVYTEDLWTYSTGYSIVGHGVNHEQSYGTIRHVRPYLRPNGLFSKEVGSGTNQGHHITFNNKDVVMNDFTIEDPSFDAGANGALGAQQWLRSGSFYNSSGTPIEHPYPVVIRNGVTFEARKRYSYWLNKTGTTTSGTFTLTVPGGTTGALAHNINNADLATAINAVSTTDVTVIGTDSRRMLRYIGEAVSISPAVSIASQSLVGGSVNITSWNASLDPALHYVVY